MSMVSIIYARDILLPCYGKNISKLAAMPSITKNAKHKKLYWGAKFILRTMAQIYLLQCTLFLHYKNFMLKNDCDLNLSEAQMKHKYMEYSNSTLNEI